MTPSTASPEHASDTDTFSTLLFSLPAELRLQIYSHALSHREHDRLDCLNDERILQWLTYSPTIFHEAAPLLYNTHALFFPLEFIENTRGRSLISLFRAHVEGTFLYDRRWAYGNVAAVVRKVEIEVATRPKHPLCRLGDDDGDIQGESVSDNVSGLLKNVWFMLHQGLPAFPAVRELKLIVHLEGSWTETERSIIEDAWNGGMDGDVCADLLLRVPFLERLVDSVEGVNERVRAAWPSLREVRWAAKMHLEARELRIGVVTGLAAVECTEGLIAWVGNWRAHGTCEGGS